MTSSGTSNSGEHTTLYYFGMVLSVVGLLLILLAILRTGQNSARSNFGAPPSSIVWVPEGQDPEAMRSAYGVIGFDCNAEVRTYSGKEPPLPSSPEWKNSPSTRQSNHKTGSLWPGLMLFIIGAVMMSIGYTGRQGVGTISQFRRQDRAQKIRQDDTFRASDIASGAVERVPNGQGVARVRCPRCHALNDDDACFCKACGASI